MTEPADLPGILAERASATPGTVAYEFVCPGNSIQTLTYGELWQRAGGLAASILRYQDGAREPVVILYPPGLEYVIAVYACFLAGVPAVPAYPPDPGRPEASRARLTRIMRDLGAPTVLAGDAAAGVVRTYGGRVLSQRAGDRPGTGPPLPATGDIALIQYTSGSSSAPRGVVVRHGNLRHNMRAIARCMHVGRTSRAMMWLPPYHDMGLIGGILTPLFVGFPVRLMAPFDFLKRPLEWLRQISDFRATVSGGPNFAYDLCVRRHAREGGVSQADLSCWEVAFNGAEPVRAQTMETFARTFASAGFDRRAFFPCYGLAEATLLVSGEHWDGRPADGLGRVSCGSSVPGQTVIVAGPETGERLADGTEGEIWVSGPSVTDGYWDGTAGLFAAGLFAEHEGRRFLRTGDTGYLCGGRLVVTGRTKDVLVHRGANYHAADVELAAVADAQGLRQVAAAFMAEREGGTEIVVVVEARGGDGSAEKLAAAVRRRVLTASGLAVDTVVVAPAGTVPRTSSGKIQRPLCRARYLAGEYDDLVPSGAASARSAAARSAAAGLPAFVERFHQPARCQVTPCIGDELLELIGVNLGQPDEDGGKVSVMRLGKKLHRVSGYQRIFLLLISRPDRDDSGIRQPGLAWRDAFAPDPHQTSVFASPAPHSEAEVVVRLPGLGQRENDTADIGLVSHDDLTSPRASGGMEAMQDNRRAQPG